jgi:hypothetical protein
VNCNQQLCIEHWSVINFHREIEPANLLQYDSDLYSTKMHLFSSNYSLDNDIKPKYTIRLAAVCLSLYKVYLNKSCAFL